MNDEPLRPATVLTQLEQERLARREAAGFLWEAGVVALSPELQDFVWNQPGHSPLIRARALLNYACNGDNQRNTGVRAGITLAGPDVDLRTIRGRAR